MQCEACGHSNLEGARFCARCGAGLPAASSGPDPLIGQLIGGRFRVTGVLGEGGMGVVYVGEQQMGSTVRKVAIKTLHSHLSKDPSVLARFHRECGTVAQLEHPNTIKVYDFGATSDGTLYIAMEFVAGRPLADVIQKEGALAPDRVVKIMRQICGALDEAHQSGIIHRDLKPDNVILTDRAGETDFVKLLDFGIAARSESADAQKEQKLTQQGMVLGTPPYMSPEQFTGKALDARSDVYSLAVMAYEMLTGRLPFEADTPWQWATQHMTAQPLPFEVAAPAKSIPTGMRAAILRALSKDREQRQSSARAFYDELSDGGRITVD
ncbi:MAG: serine/threonine-protein kinase, partial [Pseudomonadota bacterium]